jgi:hypothetical protein
VSVRGEVSLVGGAVIVGYGWLEGLTVEALITKPTVEDGNDCDSGLVVLVRDEQEEIHRSHRTEETANLELAALV